MFNTRSGFWMLISIGALSPISAGSLLVLGLNSDVTYQNFVRASGFPMSVILPMIAILAVTSEWSQRTAMTTFTLAPSRARVMVAKLSASVVCSLVALVFCLVVGAGATAIHPASGAGAWTLHAVLLPQALLYLATAMITGVAFGAALLVSAPAIVIYLLLPTIWSALSNSISALKGPSDWLEASNTLDPMVRHALGATDWLQAGATLALWMALPLAIGWWRVMRRDVG